MPWATNAIGRPIDSHALGSSSGANVYIPVADSTGYRLAKLGGGGNITGMYTPPANQGATGVLGLAAPINLFLSYLNVGGATSVTSSMSWTQENTHGLAAIGCELAAMTANRTIAITMDAINHTSLQFLFVDYMCNAIDPVFKVTLSFSNYKIAAFGGSASKITGANAQVTLSEYGDGFTLSHRGKTAAAGFVTDITGNPLFA